MAVVGPKFSHVKVITRDRLVDILESVPETKDLVIDPQLMKPLDHFAGASFLKEHGVDKIFKLEGERLDAGGNKRIYLLRPELLSTKFVADVKVGWKISVYLFTLVSKTENMEHPWWDGNQGSFVVGVVCN